MIIKSKRNKFDIRINSSFISKLLGLMFRFPKKDGILMVFKKEELVSLHTLFVFFPIDIVYVNKEKTITKIQKTILPFTLFLPPVKCKYILEVKDSKNLKINDKLEL